MYHFISTSFLLNIFYVLFWKRILKVSFGILVLWIMFLVHPSLEIPMFWTMLILWGFAGDCPAAFYMKPRPGRVLSLSLARWNNQLLPNRLGPSQSAHLLVPSFLARWSVHFTKAHTVYTHFLAPQSNWLSLNVVGSCGAILRFFDCLFNVSYLLYDRDEREYPGGQRQVLRTAQAPLWSIVQWP